MTSNGKKDEEVDVDISKRFHLDKLTSDVFGVTNPPKDWADVSLLVPHETLRREMEFMVNGINKLNERIHDETLQDWQAVWFCEWIIDYFEPFVREHHDVEEEYYFPWILTKAPEIPAKQFSKSHEELMQLLDEIGTLCMDIITKNEITSTSSVFHCKESIEELQRKIHKFVPEMKQHIMEEERDVPPLAKKYFTEQDEKREVMDKMMKTVSLKQLRFMFPPALDTMEIWASNEYVLEFRKKLPGPLVSLADNYWRPDFDTSIKPKRDAPFLEGTKPTLTLKGCCGISICFKCIC